MLRRYELANHPSFPDHRAEALKGGFLSRAVPEARNWKLRYVDVIWIETDQDAAWDEVIASILLDPVLHEQTLHPKLHGVAMERRLLPGMTDNRARTLVEALQLQIPTLDPEKIRVRTGEMVVLEGERNLPFVKHVLKDFLKPWWMNPVIHEFNTYEPQEMESLRRFESHEVNSVFAALRTDADDAQAQTAVETFAIADWSDDQLIALSQERTLALTLEEMRTVQKHHRDLGRPITDVELEVIAQTWSEHCQHKLFAAKIDYHSTQAGDPATEIPREVNGLFRETIRKTTAETKKPWLLSVFSDNAGIVQFTENEAICLKVETHNSPSALDPFGGAITGIVGVNRDILGCGLGAKPIANMDVFCVAPPDATNPMPEKIIDPNVLLDGIRAGVESGGNQSGIPTVNGSVTFHPSYLGKPLVFCGTLGLMPTKIGDRPIEEKHVQPGDLIVMLGGRIGRDGIHGATFSSMALTETVSGSVVQLGDPITQKRMTDFLLEARDRNLYRAITDNGAGGLSSSVGEMAKLSGGARMDVGVAPTKVPGLRPYERVISESQERMTLAVSGSEIQEFMALARRRGVEATVIGEFDSSGKFAIDCHGKRVADLDLKFLHEGTPQLHLQARWHAPEPAPVVGKPTAGPHSIRDLSGTWTRVLAHPNVASKEWIIRQYDHEVQARSVLKPLTTLEGRSSPTDAAVVRVSDKAPVAAVLGHGLCPLLSQADPYVMAQLAVDEALRNVLCTGAEYSTTDASAVLSLVDNFCWPDPSQSPEKAAALVRTAYGMRKACLEFKLPLISGKDSMKNDFKSEKAGKKIEISVLPTLLMTALGRMKDFSKTRSSDLKEPGDEVYLLGPASVSLRGSIVEDLGLVKNDGEAPLPHYTIARALYEFMGSPASHFLRSAHDCSEGGLFAALAEKCFARNLGVHLSRKNPWSIPEAFGEGFHRFVVSCSAEDADELQEICIERAIPFEHIGTVVKTPFIHHGKDSIPLNTLRAAWEGASV